jgi:hypothetical protein
MNNSKTPKNDQSDRRQPLTEEKGLQPAKNPPPMPMVKPPAYKKKG